MSVVVISEKGGEEEDKDEVEDEHFDALILVLMLLDESEVRVDGGILDLNAIVVFCSLSMFEPSFPDEGKEREEDVDEEDEEKEGREEE